MAVPTKGNNSSGGYPLSNASLNGNLSSYTEDDRHAGRGYPPESFVVKISQEYLCNICERVLCKPMVSGCGCRFCYLCIQEFLMDNQGSPKVRCPACNELDPGELLPDAFARKHLQKQSVYCENKRLGCEHVFPLAMLRDHLQICEYQTSDCANGCGAKVLISNATHHLETECPLRSVQCQFCQKSFRQNELEEHSATCKETLVPCPNGCNASAGIPSQQLAQHLEECPEQVVDCYFEAWGCDYRGPRKDLNEHLKTNIQRHYSGLGREVTQLKTAVTELQDTAEGLRAGHVASSSSGDVVETVDKLNERMKKLQLTMVQKFDKIGKLEKNAEQTAKRADLQKEASRIDTIASQTTTLSNRIQKLEEKAAGQGPRGRKAGGASQQSLEQRVSTLENQISLHAMRLAEHDVRFQVHGTTSYNGNLVWKIKDYARRKRDADSGKTLSLYSQPFFSSRYGFKMCARVYLNGDGIGKDSHMSLFFVIMKGDYDSLLSWPFKQKVTLMLLDQDNTRRHLSDSFRPDPTSSSFQKPTAEMNIASGCPLFVSQEVFLNSTSYLKDDTIFLKIVVDTSDVTPL